MAANFPNSPNINDTFTSNGVTFKWDGSAWKQPASPGVKGIKGDQGEKGEKGQKGEKGEKGTKGEIGSSGNPGGKGDKGAPGADGSDGSDGDKGQKGEKGQKGQDGADATGTKGQKGEIGEKGQKGEDNSTKGEKGQKGQDGADATGTKGQKGDTGSKGQKGEDNSTKGEKGQKGQDGADATGTKGEKGQKGQDGADATGTKGEKGQKGQDGTDATGTKGEKGQKGQDGTDATGTKGQKGDTGSKGQKGEDGSDGSSVKGQKGEVGTTTKGQKGEPGQKGQQGASGSASISNNADNRVITGGTGTNLNAEQNLTFDGSTLNVIGSGTPTIESASNLDITATSTKFSGTASFAGGHPTSNFYSGADDLVVANFTQDTGISIMSGSTNTSTIAFGSTTFGSGAIAARVMYESMTDLVLETLTTGHDIKLKAAGQVEIGDRNNPRIIVEDRTSGSYGVEVDGTLYPKAPVGDLGLSGVRWNNIYGSHVYGYNLYGDGSNITNIPTSAAKSGFAHNYSDTSYSGSSYQNSFGTHISCSLTPSNSNNRVVVMASFQIKRNGNQNNNAYARARLTGGGDLRECEIVRTNQISYNDSFNQFKLIAYDAAGNTSARTYNLAVNYTSGSGSSGVSIRHASIVAIELKSS